MTNLDCYHYVLRQLGAPTRNIELTEEQLWDCINFALLEVKQWFSTQFYVTLDLNGNQSVIHMPDYLPKDEQDNPRHVHEVTDVIKIPHSLIDSSTNADPFNSNFRVGGFGGGFMGIGATSGYYSNITNNSIHHIIGQFARQRNEMFYGRLAQILWQRTAGAITPGMNFEFHRGDQNLYLGMGYPPSSSVTIEYVPVLTDFGLLVDERYIRIAQDLALGQAMVLQARITGKFNISNAPSQINYSDIRAEGQQLIERARDELKRIHRNFVIID